MQLDLEGLDSGSAWRLLPPGCLSPSALWCVTECRSAPCEREFQHLQICQLSLACLWKHLFLLELSVLALPQEKSWVSAPKVAVARCLAGRAPGGCLCFLLLSLCHGHLFPGFGVENVTQVVRLSMMPEDVVGKGLQAQGFCGGRCQCQ